MSAPSALSTSDPDISPRATVAVDLVEHAEPKAHLRVTQGSVVRSEWIKFRSVRSNMITLVAAGVVLVGFGALFASLAGRSNAVGPSNAGSDALSTTFGALDLTQLILGVLGALFIASEYSSGMIRTMFTAVATRVPVLRAKALVLGAGAWGVMTAAAFAAFFIGQAVYAGSGRTFALTDPGVLRSVLGVGVYGAGVVLIGLALGFLLRSTAAAIGTLVGVLMLAPGLVSLLPGGISTPLGKILPSNAGSAFTSVIQSSDRLTPAVGFAVFAVWVVGLLVTAAVVLKRRDA